MTEQEWLQATDPKPMLEFLQGKVSDRKWRLYLCGGCRHISHLFFRPWSLTAVEVAERFADGQATQYELNRAEYSAEAASFGYELDNQRFSPSHPYRMEVVPRLVEIGALPESSLSGGEWEVDEVTRRSLVSAASLAECCARIDAPSSFSWWYEWISCVNWPGRWLVDCVFGNPFRPVALKPSLLTWHGGLPVSMARQIYDSRDFTDMSVLADGLEEAGCQDQDILSHCRSGGEHVRGCWVVDMVLGKK
jgi:hypothetical protein